MSDKQTPPPEFVCYYCKRVFPKDETLVVTDDGPCHIACLAKADREEKI